jgi:signal transduction histidine kinase/ActR/RegA family two-component response regulator
MPRHIPLHRIGDRALVAGAAGATLIALVLIGSQILVSALTQRELATIVSHMQSLQLEVERLHLSRLEIVDEFVRGADGEAAGRFREIDAAQSDALFRMSEDSLMPEEEEAASAASYTYHVMATLEGDALALALAGRVERAEEVLHAPEYLAARRQFGEALVGAREALWPRIDPLIKRIERAELTTAIVGPFSAAAILAFLALVLARLRGLADRTREAELQFASAAGEIARRERETHANLISRSPAPATEFAFPPALKLVAWLKQRGNDDLERWLKVYPGEIRKLAPQFALVRANKAAAALLKAGDPGELKDLTRWIPDRALHACALAMLRALWTRSPDICEVIEARTLDGEERTLELKGTLASNGKGEPPTLVACLTDVTDASGLRGALESERSAAAKAAEVRDEFLTTVSRDLRAALDGVTGMTAALERTRLDVEQLEALGLIRDSGEAMRDTLDRARDFRRLESGDIELANEPFDVSAVVQAVNARFSPRARAKGLRLRMAVEEAARTHLVGDASRVRQILTKLVGNAIDFTPHGEVEARVALEIEPQGGGHLVLTVRDTGAGLTSAEIDGASRTGSGSGGGLAFCRRLCAAMGGRLDIKSSSDYGTSVTARMRVGSASQHVPGAAPGAVDLAAALGRRLTLLAADDNAVNRIVLKDMLEPLDVDLTIVENGADAIAAWRARAFDAILLDIHMPVLSGHDVAREIRRIEAAENRKPTPIIAVSASVMKTEVEACLAAGMNDHVAKPIELPRLRDAIAAAVAPKLGKGEAAA